tara:strand:+ start:477 stop:935 length:459 start_codon:yes stop_codon:yes gene_type:complete
MQTFLPYDSFIKSVKSLDNKRLGKQRVEALQILKGIYIRDYGWRHHPCVKMWKDYPDALSMYMNRCIDEWVSRGFENNMKKARGLKTIELPHWLGDRRLHNSHQSNLLRKDIDYYSKHDWTVASNLPYYWCGYSKQDLTNYPNKEQTDGTKI